MGDGLELFNRIYPDLRKLYLVLTNASASTLDESYWLRRAAYEFAGHLSFCAYKA